METFGWAIKQLQNGSKVSRSGWNGKGMWLELSPAGEMYKDKSLQQHILMKTAQDNYVPWLASQTDVLSVDWGIIG